MSLEMQRVLSITTSFLAALGPKDAESQPAIKPSSPISPTSLSYPFHNLTDDLVQRGCSHTTVQELVRVFKDGINAVQEGADAAFVTTWTGVSSSGASEALLKEYKSALYLQHHRQVEEGAASLRVALLAEVDDARATVERSSHQRSSSSPSPSPEPIPEPEHLKGAHSAAAVTILTAFRDQRLAAGKEAKFNAAERRLIADKAGLTDQQVLTWFSNYRNRSLKLERRLASAKFSTTTKGGARFSPYETPRRPSAQSSQATTSRDVSSSSSASMDSTLSYAPADHSAYSLPTPPTTISHDAFMAASWSGSESSGEEQQLYEQDALLRLLEPTPARGTPSSSGIPFPSPPTHQGTSSSFPFPTYTAPASYTPVPYSQHTAMYLDSPAPYRHQAYVPVPPVPTAQDAFRAPEPWFPTLPTPRLPTFEYTFTSGDFDVARALGVDNGRGALTLPIQAGGYGMSH